MTTIQPASGRPSTSVSFLGPRIRHKLISASREAREELLGMLGRLRYDVADKTRDISQEDGSHSFGELLCGRYRSHSLYRPSS